MNNRKLNGLDEPKVKDLVTLTLTPEELKALHAGLHLLRIAMTDMGEINTTLDKAEFLVRLSHVGKRVCKLHGEHT